MYYLTSCTISVLSRAQGIFLNEIAGNFQSEPEMIYCRTLIFLLQYKILYHMSFISKLHIYTVVINILATYIINMHQKCFEYFYICIPCHVVPRMICHDLHASLCKQTILNRDSSLFSNCAISCLSFFTEDRLWNPIYNWSNPSCSSWPCPQHICSQGPPGSTNRNTAFRKIKCVVFPYKF
jgi:hypothetical protein